MDFTASVTRLLTGLGENIGLDLANPDLSGKYFCLSVNNKPCSILLNEQTHSCVFHMEFAKGAGWVSCPPEERAKRLAYLLGANIMLIGTNGAALGYDPETDTASLSMSYDVPSSVSEDDQNAFTEKLARFLETFRLWTEYVERGQPADDTPLEMPQTTFLRI